MKLELRYRIYLVTGLAILALLVWLTVSYPPGPVDPVAMIFFGLLIVFTTTFGVPLAGGSVSLLPMTTVAAYLVMGLVPTAWAALVGTVAYGLVRRRWIEHPKERPDVAPIRIIALVGANAAIHVISILAAGVVFQIAGGTPPLYHLDGAVILSLSFLGSAYLIVNYLIAGGFIASRGGVALQDYLRSLPNLVFYEGGPLIFAPLTALIYNRLGPVQLALFALLLMISSLITRNLARTSQRLERRVQELSSLQAVGQVLSASLHIETILTAIYDQVAELMPASNFYVALHDGETNEVSFPLAVEEGRPVKWRSRRMGKGLTEYILRRGKPLLIPRDVEGTLQSLGIEAIGQTAACWLGVPLLAGDEALGIIAVQSYTTPDAYDVSDQKVLTTIASQAAVAIQNARLYARTDEALARRVQELDSILRTTGEGILLLGADWQVLAANRALADFLGMAQLELSRASLEAPQSGGNRPLIDLIGYSPATLRADCATLANQAKGEKQTIITMGQPERYVERTLTPVRDRQGTIAGWLLIFRDITEEIELARMRDDMTHMLVHDLRSPLTVLKGSLGFLQRAFTAQDEENFLELFNMAERSTDRMLGMVNELLDISKLESGQLVLDCQAIPVKELFADIVTRLAPLAADAHISLDVSVESDLPPLYVDHPLLSRVLNNLVDNAIKFTPDGGHVQLWARPASQYGPGYLLLGVSDTGPGIPEGERHLLFEKFQQVKSIEGRRSGSGLGLPFCKLVVEAHGGDIWVESEVGQGSTFLMTLPVAPD